MIVRRLRAKRNWSQEQLADFSGLSVRTIQRVEKGQKASIETLKSIASVFEVDISTLTEEIVVINKDSEDWKGLPLWFRFNVWGIQSRKSAIYVELFLLGLLMYCWWEVPKSLLMPFMILLFYTYILVVRYGDRKKVW